MNNPRTLEGTNDHTTVELTVAHALGAMPKAGPRPPPPRPNGSHLRYSWTSLHATRAALGEETKRTLRECMTYSGRKILREPRRTPYSQRGLLVRNLPPFGVG